MLLQVQKTYNLYTSGLEQRNGFCVEVWTFQPVRRCTGCPFGIMINHVYNVERASNGFDTNLAGQTLHM